MVCYGPSVKLKSENELMRKTFGQVYKGNYKLDKRQKTLEEQAKLSRQSSAREKKNSLRKTFGDIKREQTRDTAFAEVNCTSRMVQ